MKAAIILLLIYGCSTGSQYEEAQNSGDGFSDKVVEQDLRMAEFKGNSKTKKENAQLFAKFRAIEVCTELGRKLAHIMVVRDQSSQKDVAQTVTDYPTYYYGAAPYYGRFGASGGAVGVYAYPASTRTYNETYTYPRFDVYFECVDTPYDARMSFKALSNADVKDLVKDLEGAVKVDEVLPDSPNKDTFKPGDIIITANDMRVQNLLELYKASRSATDNKFKVDFFRSGKKMSATAKLLDVTDMVTQSQAEIIKEACKNSDIKNRPICKKGK